MKQNLTQQEFAEKRIDELIETIQYHNDLYYFQDRNIITDAEYDALLCELQQLEEEYPRFVREDSPTRKVGDKLKSELKKIKHNVPMLSIQAVFEKYDVVRFVERMKEAAGDDVDFIVEPKIDGLSVGLRYVNGAFYEGMTRGDGVSFGEDVTENLRMIREVNAEMPEALPYMEIRGEVYCSDASFADVNRRLRQSGQQEFANSRNCASATLRQSDPHLLEDRELSIFIFDIQDIRGKTFAEDMDSLKYLESLGVNILPGCVICKTGEEVWKAVEKIGYTSSGLGYQIDGAVVKVNDLSLRKKIGTTQKVPKWAVAYKYSEDEKQNPL